MYNNKNCKDCSTPLIPGVNVTITNRSEKLPKMRIAFVGYAGSGKSSTANAMVKQYGGIIISFAKSLKNIAKIVLGREINKATDRLYLQKLGGLGRGDISKDDFLEVVTANYGQEIAKESVKQIDKLKTDNLINFGKDFWPRLALSNLPENDNIYVDDSRFLLECEMLRQLGFKIVNVGCIKNICAERLKARDGKFSNKIWNDISEKEWKEVEYDLVVNSVQESPDEIAEFIFHMLIFRSDILYGTGHGMTKKNLAARNEL